MLRIRFKRVGRRNQPFFRIVVTNSRNAPKGGRDKEIVGFYNPLTKEYKIEKERVLYWLSVGAQPSDSVYNLLIRAKVIQGKKKPVHAKPKKESSQEEGAQSKEEST